MRITHAEQGQRPARPTSCLCMESWTARCTTLTLRLTTVRAPSGWQVSSTWLFLYLLPSLSRTQEVISAAPHRSAPPGSGSVQGAKLDIAVKRRECTFLLDPGCFHLPLQLCDNTRSSVSDGGCPAAAEPERAPAPTVLGVHARCRASRREPTPGRSGPPPGTRGARGRGLGRAGRLRLGLHTGPTCACASQSCVGP